MTKTISQNPDRYSKVGNQWVISANGDSPNKGVTPLKLNITTLPFKLKPYLKSDGIIIKAGEHYLISKMTLDEITNSTNPHYDAKENGVVLVKSKLVKIGKTIPIISVNIDNLPKIGSERDIRNRNAGIASVDYLYEGPKIDGVPQNLIDQINYTLVQDVDRPNDKFSVLELQLGDDNTVYNIEPLNVATAQDDKTLDKKKLEIFLTDINARLKILRTDFNMIKGVFLEGKEVTTLGRVDLSLKAETNPVEETGQIVYKYTTLSGIQVSAQQQVADAAAAAKKAIDDAAKQKAADDLAAQIKATTPKHLKLRRVVFPDYMVVLEKDESLGLPDNKIIKRIYDGKDFYGYFLKDFGEKKIYVVMNPDKKTIFGYGTVGKLLKVEEIN
jgi:hypothetical protein